MSNKSKHKKQHFHQKQSSGALRKKAPSVKNAPDIFWEPFIAYNRLEAPQHAETLKSLGITDTDRAVIGVLAKSHFVIPGKTFFECQRCGECCRYARKVAQLTYEPCPFLSAENTCAKHDNRYLVCKWFPFWIYYHPKHGSMLTIKPY